MSDNVILFPEPETITTQEVDALRQGGTPEASLFQAESMLRAAYTLLLAHWAPADARELLCRRAATCGTLRQGESVTLNFLEEPGP